MSWKFLNKKAVSDERLYNVLRAPVITEKATLGSENNQVVFKVADDANKHEIKVAVETLFKVSVESVKTVVVKGKEKRFRGRIGHRSDFKKAIVRLKDGDSIDVATGL